MAGRRNVGVAVAEAHVAVRTRRNQQPARSEPVEGLNIAPVGSSEWIRMMLFAFPGVGKTSLIATGAKEYRTLIVRSSMDLVPKRALDSGAEEIVADTHEKMLEILQWAQQTTTMPYDWIWWDCISIAQDVLLDDVWQAVVAEKPHRASLTPSGGLDRGEYGRNMERISSWVRHMVGCRRFHFGITAHPMEGPHPANDEGGDLLRPWVQGKQMSEKICGYMNMVGFLNFEEDHKRVPDKYRRLYFAESPRFFAKDHFDAFLPDGYVDEPTIPAIMAAVRAAREGRTPATTRRGRR